MVNLRVKPALVSVILFVVDEPSMPALRRLELRGGERGLFA